MLGASLLDRPYSVVAGTKDVSTVPRAFSAKFAPHFAYNPVTTAAQASDRMTEDPKNTLDAYYETLAKLQSIGGPSISSEQMREKNQAEMREKYRRAPIGVPKIQWWQRPLLTSLSLPNPMDMLREMMEITSDRSPMEWKFLGRAGPLGAHEMDGCLCPHPNGLLAEALHGLAQSCFPPEVMVEFSFYFTEGPERRTLRPARIQQVYVFFLYLSGTERQAAIIDRLVGSSSELRELRATITRAKTDFALQESQIEAYKAAMNAWRAGAAKGDAPDWRDYLTH